MRVKKRNRLILAAAALPFVVLLIVALRNDLTVSTYEIRSSDLPGPFDGFRIVLLSDLHNNRFGSGQSELIALVERQNPDVVFLAGDMYDDKAQDISPVVELVRGLSDSFPVYMVSGNHERYSAGMGYDDIRRTLVDAGAMDMDDSAGVLSQEGSTVRLYGLADNRASALLRQGSNEHEIFSSMPKSEEFAILLYHRSDDFGRLSELPFDLVLSGHTHGGQIRLPFVGGLLSPNRTLFPDYAGGRFDANGHTLISSRGLGSGNPIPRIFNPPEIVTVILRADGQSAQP